MQNRILGFLLISLFALLICDVSLADRRYDSDRRSDRDYDDLSRNPSTGNPGPYYPEYDKPEHYQDRDHE